MVDVGIVIWTEPLVLKWFHAGEVPEVIEELSRRDSVFANMALADVLMFFMMQARYNLWTGMRNKRIAM